MLPSVASYTKKALTIAGLYWVSSLTFVIEAQDNTQYPLTEIPQTIYLNPAIHYKCRTYIELPIISSTGFYYNNSGFAYNQAIKSGYGTTGDSLTVDFDRLSQVLHNKNSITTGIRFSIVGAGFALGDYYFSFNISNRTQTRLSFTRDVIGLKDGNWDVSNNVPRQLVLNGTGFNAQSFIEISAGASKKLFDDLSAGIRVKYLIGSANLQTRRSDLSLQTSDGPIILTGISDIKLRSSFPADVSYDNNGFVTGIDVSRAGSNIVQNYLFNGNHGLAFDAGVIYDYSDQITLSASLLDLGFIRWKGNTNQFTEQGSFTFNGFDLNQYFQDPGETNLLQALTDSISNSFQFDNSTKKYFTSLSPQLFLSGQYKINGHYQAGMVFHNQFYGGQLHSSITLSATARPLNWVTGSLSWSAMNNSLMNLGAALVLGNKGVQFYFVTDNIPLRWVKEANTKLMWPYSARTFNFRFGLNLLFGCNEEEQGWKGKNNSELCPAYQ